jgi:gluconokinase
MTTSDVIVLMGVSRSGKTSVGRSIAADTGWDYVEGDAFLTPAERVEFEAGHLSDADSERWLRSLGQWIDGYEKTGRSAVVACPALTRRHRDILREGRPDVRFCHLTADRATLRDRAGGAAAQHLRADLRTIEPLGRDEHGVTVSSAGAEEEVGRRVLSALGLDPGHS